jgi:hypothetical protein
MVSFFTAASKLIVKLFALHSRELWRLPIVQRQSEQLMFRVDLHYPFAGGDFPETNGSSNLIAFRFLHGLH